MPGTIVPLPVMLEDEDRKAYEKLEAPRSIVLRYGYMKLIAELPYDGEAKPGCGSKLVIRTERGIELAEMLTTTCPNAGCGSAVSRKQLLQYVENSGGKKYPFTNQGKVLRVATVDDVNEQKREEARKPEIIRYTKALLRELDLPMKLVDVEILLGGERIIFHYTSEQWVDFRALVKQLAGEYQTRIEMHQVNARDEARLVADYERCGQHCCCKQFLKVLKPVSMRSAKVQKATLDPTKISGRCGRLMCCLRYEDETYESLRKKLPHKQSRVMTADGPGTVIDTQILTQLALVALDNGAQPAAYPIEQLEKLTGEAAMPPPAPGGPSPGPGASRSEGRREPRRDDRRSDRREGRGEARGEGRREGGGPQRDREREGGRRERDEAARDADLEALAHGDADLEADANVDAKFDANVDTGFARELEADADDNIDAGGDDQALARGEKARAPDAGPRRPRPGQPLSEHEVESREGDRPMDPPAARGAGAGASDDTGDDAGDDAAGESGDAAASSPSQGQASPAQAGGGEANEGGQRRRKRRRRRKRKRGAPGSDAPGSDAGNDAPPGSGGHGNGGPSAGGGPASGGGESS